MGACIRCKGEYDDTTKLCARCGADNTKYVDLTEQGFSLHVRARLFAGFLPLAILLVAWIIVIMVGFPVSVKVILVLSIVGLVIWFLVTLPMFVLSYAARFTFWEREYLRELDFLAKRPRGTGSLIAGTLLLAVLLILTLGGIFILNMVSPNAPGLEYTVTTVTLALFFSIAIAAFCYSLIIVIEAKQLETLLPQPIFMDDQVLQDLAVESARESLKLSKRETNIAEMKRTDSAGIDLIVRRTTKEFVIDERGERIEKTKTQRFQVKADKWGRVTAIEEKKKD